MREALPWTQLLYVTTTQVGVRTYYKPGYAVTSVQHMEAAVLLAAGYILVFHCLDLLLWQRLNHVHFI
jgi:hypothetical protein